MKNNNNLEAWFVMFSLYVLYFVVYLAEKQEKISSDKAGYFPKYDIRFILLK